MELFSIQCTTCNARLKVRDTAAIGHILACPKCGGMVQVAPPPGWAPPVATSTAGTAAAGAAAVPPSNPADSVSGYTIKIPAEQIAALKAAKRLAAEQAAAAAATSAAAVAASEPAAPVNPRDVPPLPPTDDQPGFAARVAASVSRNWLWFVCAPAVAFVLALLVWAFLFQTSPQSVQVADASSAESDASVKPPLAADGAAESSTHEPPAVAPPDTEVAADATQPAEQPATEPSAPDTASDAAADASIEPAGAPIEGPQTVENAHADAANPDVAHPDAVRPDAANSDVAPDNVVARPAGAAEGAESPQAAVPPEEGPAARVANLPANPAAPAQEPAAAQDPAAASPMGDQGQITHDLVPEVEVDARLADPLPALEFRRVPLADFCDFLSHLSTVPITLDVDALGLSGIHPSDLLAVKSEDATVGEALADAISKRGLVHVVQGHQVIVTTLDRKADGLAPVRYEVHDLASNPAELTHLATLVTRFVAPLSWQQHGGKATVDIDGDVLIVNQTPIAQRRTSILLDRLRQARRLPTAEQLRPDESTLKTHYDLARAGLDKEVTANFAIDCPLTEILSWLARATGTRILIDEASLADAGLWSGWPATLSADHQPLDEALAALLSPLGMTYRVVDDRTVQVFARQALPARFECELYPVSDLLGRGISDEELIKKLCDRIGAEHWAAEAGPAAIELDKESGHLLVMQSPEIQIRVEELLEKAKSGVRAQ